MNLSIMWGIAILAIGTYLIRIAGPLLGKRFQFSSGIRVAIEEVSSALLFTVAIVATFYGGQTYAGHAHVVGVLVSAIMAFRRFPFIVVVLTAAAVTALLRFIGVP